MKKVLLLLVLSLCVNFMNAQKTFLGGYLKVEPTEWALSFQNNEYKQITDIGTILFTSKEDATTFVNDYGTALNDVVEIKTEKYSISSTKKIITVTNSNGKTMVVMKKYSKKGFAQMKESLKYM